MTNTIRWDQDSDGIVVLTLDDPNQSANTMNADFRESFGRTVDRLESEKDSITGVVLTSAKKTFFAGGDLNDLIKATPEHAEEITRSTDEMKAQLRRLETLGKPVVAAINGAALGGGLEIALATHHRIVADVKGTVIGLPEVSLGLLPGGGGVARTVRLLGIQSAVLNVLVQGQRHKPAKALELGLVHELVSSVDELLPKAKEWIKANPEAQQPWDVKGYKIPGGSPSNPKFAANLPAFPANLRKQIKGAPMPAPRAILAAAVEGAQVDIDTATKIETRYFVSLVTGQVAKNMTKAFFFDLQHINSGGSRPDGYEKYTAKKVGVLGAGMMGAAIAYVSAKAGIDVVLKDVSLEAAEKGKGYAVKLEEKALSRGRTTKEKSDELLARIKPSADPEDFKGVDFVIEAVFESQELKHKVFGEIENIVNADAVLGSNTSTLPITGLAQGVQRQEDFIGIHFFSPVDKMPLVEIIRGEKTSDATLAKVFDFTLQIKKTPIVVNDSRGFFTSRVIGTFINEAVAAVGEGVEPAVDRAGRFAGRVPGAAAAAHGRADPDAAAEDPAGDARRGRGRGRDVERARVGGRDRPHARRIRPQGPVFGRRVLRVRGRQAGRPVAGPAGGVQVGQRAGAVQGPAGADAVRGGAGDGEVLRRGRAHVGAGRQHRVDLRHRLPGLDRWCHPVHQPVRGRAEGLRRAGP